MIFRPLNARKHSGQARMQLVGQWQHGTKSVPSPLFATPLRRARHYESLFRRWINRHARSRDDLHGHGPGKWAAIERAGSGASGDPRATLDRSGTRSSDEGAGATPDQRKQIRPLLEEHHDRIQALFDKNPKLSRQDLGPRIHAISDETHHQIEALLTNPQKQLAKAMQGACKREKKQTALLLLNQRDESE